MIRDTHYRKLQKPISHVAHDIPVKSIVLLLVLIPPAALNRLTPGAKVIQGEMRGSDMLFYHSWAFNFCGPIAKNINLAEESSTESDPHRFDLSVVGQGVLAELSPNA